MSGALERGLAAHFSDRALRRLGRVRVGIAGVGGIGSNVAWLLARSGVRRMLLVDRDAVEESNLNRQAYLPGDVGEGKAEALARGLSRLSDALEIEVLRGTVGRGNVRELLPRADVWVEGMDGAEDKRNFAEAAALLGVPAVSCSGLAGVGGPPPSVRRVGSLTVVGDFSSDVRALPPCAPRAVACAALMADRVLSLVLGGADCPLRGVPPERYVRR